MSLPCNMKDDFLSSVKSDHFISKAICVIKKYGLGKKSKRKRTKEV